MPATKQRITTKRPARRALILGITGQVGSYLVEHLLDEGYLTFVKRESHGPRYFTLKPEYRDAVR